MYHRFREVIEDEMNVGNFDDVEATEYTLQDVKEMIEKRIVKDAMRRRNA